MNVFNAFLATLVMLGFYAANAFGSIDATLFELAVVFLLWSIIIQTGYAHD